MENTEQVTEAVVEEKPKEEPKAVCPECGKEFFGYGCKGSLAGHMKSHFARKRSEIKHEDRKERVPFGIKERKYDLPEDDGFVYRVFNDNWAIEPGRINRALKAGYEIVDNQEFNAVGTNENGSEIRGVLMRIPKEFYLQDQKAKQKAVDEIDRKIKGGKLEAGQNDNRYSRDGIRVWDNNTENP